jgi:hypothetical protein
MVWINIIASIIGTCLAAYLGTYWGSKLIIDQQEKNKKPSRDLLNSIISDFSKYQKYKSAEEQFNTRSVIEKKTVLVALKNLGVPVKINLVDDRFDIEKIEFLDSDIKEEEIKKMKEYVSLGLCDALFFNDIDSGFFQSPPKIIRAREIAIKVLQSIELIDFQPKDDLNKLIKAAKITTSQFDVVYVFWLSLYIIDKVGDDTIEYNKEKINTVIQDVKNGIFDHLFYWDHRAFNNMNQQMQAAASMSSIMDYLPKMVSPPKGD